MQIHEAAIGRQLHIHGNVVCVPADISTTVNTLSRTSSQFETIAVQLKRRSQYQHAVLTSNVRPSCIRQVGTYLVQHGQQFQQEKISFNHSVLASLQSDNILTGSDSLDETHDNSTMQSDNAPVSTELSTSTDEAVTEQDSWNEVHDTEVERAGIFDTLFTAADFVEDSESSCI